MAYGLRLSGIGKKQGMAFFEIKPTWWKIPGVRGLVTHHWVKTKNLSANKG